MTGTGIHRARLSVDFEEPDRTTCRFFSPQQPADEISAIGQIYAADEVIIADYRSDLESLFEIGPPPGSGGLSGHHEKRKLAAETLARIGLPQAIADQLTRLQMQIGNDTLLLEFSTTTPELDCLPWELLGSRELGRQGNSNLVVWRYVTQESHEPWPKNNVMLASASPPEQRISPNVDGEFDDIRALLELSGRRDVQPTVIRHSTNPRFTATLADSQPNLLHAAMHGSQTSMFFEREDPRDQVVLERASANEPLSRQRVVPYEYLAGVIADIGSVRTAILSVCFSAYSDETETSFARRLISEGIPSVIGMACNITPVASREFCRELYRGICTGRPIADSYARAITSLRRMSSYDECLWSVPMLYGSDNVIPLPTGDYKQFLSGVAQAVNSIDELRRNLNRLSLQVSSRPGNWRVDSTRAAMGLGRVQKGLKYLRDNMTPKRVDSYIWRLEFDVGCTEIERKISLVRAAMSEVGEGIGRATVSQDSQRFRSAAERLVPELDNIRRLVIDEFPVISHIASAS
jgi:CHAT domain